MVFILGSHTVLSRPQWERHIVRNIVALAIILVLVTFLMWGNSVHILCTK
jgi:hypothetical protein